MSRQYIVDEAGLAAMAKQFRLRAGKTKIEAAADLKVGRPTVQLAEENPEQSLTKLRIRLIEKYSQFNVIWPVYLVKKKPRKMKG